MVKMSSVNSNAFLILIQHGCLAIILSTMNIKFYAPVWGNNLPFDTFCSNVKAAGYDGIEMDLPLVQKDKTKLLSILKDYDLQMVGQYWQSLEQNIDEHLVNFERIIRHLHSANPVFINSQTGKDYFTFEENKRLFDLADNLSKELGVRIVHETHRGKCLFAAHITKFYLSEIPELRLTLDISHWCNVHESLLTDQQEAINWAIARTDHIHSRVGYPEGPQVNDPRAPEWKEVVASHLSWWDAVVKQHQNKKTVLTITTEFGPPTYMPVMPYTQLPLADQWDVNVYMMNLLKNRYSIQNAE